GELTEAAPPRRFEQLRDEGRAARSPELGSAIGLLAGCVILQTTAGNAATRLQGLLTGTFTDLSASGRAQDIDVLWAQQALGRAGEAWLLSIAPLLLVLTVLGIGIGLAQGTILRFKALLPFETLYTLNWFKRLLPIHSLVGHYPPMHHVTMTGLR